MFLKIPDKINPDLRLNNKFWKLHKRTGRKRIFETPEELWAKCCEYFEWIEDNPLYEERAFSTKFGIELVDVRKQRAMTMKGLFVFIGISKDAWYNRYGKNEDFKWVIDIVTDIVYTQKFEGAAAGMLNANLIARDLGLADKQELNAGVTVTKRNFNDFYNNEEE